jgi:hypothetical protein
LTGFFTDTHSKKFVSTTHLTNNFSEFTIQSFKLSFFSSSPAFSWKNNEQSTPISHLPTETRYLALPLASGAPHGGTLGCFHGATEELRALVIEFGTGLYLKTATRDKG